MPQLFHQLNTEIAEKKIFFLILFAHNYAKGIMFLGKESINI